MSDPLHQLGRAQAAAVEANGLAQQLDKPFAAMEAEYIRRWRASKDINEREDAWLMLRALDEFRGHLLAVAKGGDVAAFNLRKHIAARTNRG
jgi:hypothetical protein